MEKGTCIEIKLSSVHSSAGAGAVEEDRWAQLILADYTELDWPRQSHQGLSLIERRQYPVKG